MEMDISEIGNIGTKGETRGNRDEWRGVGDVMEIDGLWNGKGIVEDDGVETDLSKIHRWLISNTNSMTIHDFIPSGKLMSSTTTKSLIVTPSTNKCAGLDGLNHPNSMSMKKCGTKIIDGPMRKYLHAACLFSSSEQGDLCLRQDLPC